MSESKNMDELPPSKRCRIESKSPGQSRHNNVEYYLKGEELDTKDTKIMKINNNIYFYSPITRESACSLIELLIQVDTKNMEHRLKNPAAPVMPIRLHLLSEGGDIFSALAISQNMRQLTSPLEGYVNGILSSATLIVFMGCHKRFMFRDSFIGLHAMKLSVWGKLQFLNQCSENYKKVIKCLEQLYKDNTNLLKGGNSMKTLMSKSDLLDSTVCLDVGLVTNVI